MSSWRIWRRSGAAGHPVGEREPCRAQPVSGPLPDGTRIAFNNGGALVADDANHLNEIYVKTIVAGAIQRVSTATYETQSNGFSLVSAWSPDGNLIAFTSTATNLLRGDPAAGKLHQVIGDRPIAEGLAELGAAISLGRVRKPAKPSRRSPSWLRTPRASSSAQSGRSTGQLGAQTGDAARVS